MKSRRLKVRRVVESMAAVLEACILWVIRVVLMSDNALMNEVSMCSLCMCGRALTEVTMLLRKTEVCASSEQWQ